MTIVWRPIVMPPEKQLLKHKEDEKAQNHVQRCPQIHSQFLERLGDSLDRLGRMQQAFDAYSRMNAETVRASDALYERAGTPESHLEFVRRLTRWFESEDAAHWRVPFTAEGYQSPVRRHVFLLGYPGSGNTLVGQILASLPEVRALQGRPTLEDADRALRCPKCTGATAPINYGYDSGIVIDRCKSCRGIWLDGTELEKVQMVAEGWEGQAEEILARHGKRLRAIEAKREKANDIHVSRFAFVNALINGVLDLAR